MNPFRSSFCLLGLAISGMFWTSLVISSATAQSTWVGTTPNLNTAANWSAAVVPGNGVAIEFNGSSAQNSPTFTTNFQGAGSGIGSMTVTSGQASALTITNVGAAGQVFRFGGGFGITIDSGAGAVSFGDGAGAGTSFLINMGTGTSNFINNSTNGATFTSDVQLNASGSTTPAVAFSGTGNWTHAGTISSTVTTLTKSGAGTLTLSGLNAYAGKTTISSGTVSINTLKNVNGGTSSLGAPTTAVNGTIDLAGTLTYTGGVTSSDRVLNLTIPGAGVTINNSGSGTLTLTGGITGGASNILFRGSGNITQSGLIVNSNAAGNLSHTDNGNLTLTNPGNSFTGNLVIATGTVNANSIADSGINSAIGAGTTIALGQNNTSPNGTFQFSGASGGSSNRVLNLTRGSGATATIWKIENTVANQLLSLSGDVALTNPAGGTGTMLLELAGAGNGSLSDNISGSPAFGLRKSGAGTWTVSGTNTYTGLTSAGGGTLVLSGSSATSGITLNAGTNTTLRVTNTAATGTGLINTSTGVTTPVLQFHIDGGGTIALPNALGGNSGIATTIDVNNNGSGSNGIIQLNGSMASSAIGTVTYNITGGNGYSLSIANLRNTAGSAGTVLFNPTTATVSLGNLTGSQPNGTNIWNFGGTSTGNIVTGTISNGGSGSLTGAVTKSGSSTWTLSGSNTYTGTTSVNQGRLVVNGSIIPSSGSSSLNVASGATLAGSGTLGSPTNNVNVTIQAGGTLAPGNSPETLTHFGIYTMNPGSLFEAELAIGGVAGAGDGTNGTDRLVVNGSVTINDAILTTVWGGQLSNIFQGGTGFVNDGVFVNTGLQGLFGGGTNPYLLNGSGGTYALFYDANFTAGSLTGGNDLLLIAIPEPSRALLLLMALLPVATRRQRR